MPKTEHIVSRIMHSDPESFSKLFGKLTHKDFKKIYNKCFRRLKAKGLSKERIKAYIVDEIRTELFKLLPKVVQKITTDEEKTDKDTRCVEYPIELRGFDIWGNNEPEVDPFKQLEDNYNIAVERRFAEVFCPSCHCERSVCRCHEEVY